jgi:hypothetical protein
LRPTQPNNAPLIHSFLSQFDSLVALVGPSPYDSKMSQPNNTATSTAAATTATIVAPRTTRATATPRAKRATVAPRTSRTTTNTSATEVTAVAVAAPCVPKPSATSELKQQVKALQEQLAALVRQREEDIEQTRRSEEEHERLRQRDEEAYLAHRLEVEAQTANNQRQSQRFPTPRVPNSLVKFRGKRGEDVRQWLFQVENACRIHHHIVSDDSMMIPSIAGTAMEGSAAGWFLHWSSIVNPADQTWKAFSEAALAHFEASNYQATLRQRLRGLRQTGDIEEYNGKYSEMIFRIEDMSTIDQISNYCAGLKPKTRAYVQIEDPSNLSQAMDSATKYELAHFDSSGQGQRKDTTITDSSGKKRFFDKEKSGKESKYEGRYKAKGKFKRNFKSSKNFDDTVKKSSDTCHFCKKPGHLMKDCYSLKNKEKQGNAGPRQA